MIAMNIDGICERVDTSTRMVSPKQLDVKKIEKKMKYIEEICRRRVFVNEVLRLCAIDIST